MGDSGGGAMVVTSVCDLVLQENADWKTEPGRVGAGNLIWEDLIVNNK